MGLCLPFRSCPPPPIGQRRCWRRWRRRSTPLTQGSGWRFTPSTSAASRCAMTVVVGSHRSGKGSATNFNPVFLAGLLAVPPHSLHAATTHSSLFLKMLADCECSYCECFFFLRSVQMTHPHSQRVCAPANGTKFWTWYHSFIHSFINETKPIREEECLHEAVAKITEADLLWALAAQLLLAYLAHCPLPWCSFGQETEANDSSTSHHRSSTRWMPSWTNAVKATAALFGLLEIWAGAGFVCSLLPPHYKDFSPLFSGEADPT